MNGKNEKQGSKIKNLRNSGNLKNSKMHVNKRFRIE